MIVTIDGPAGAGKSTVAKRLAERLGFQFLDTGAMYRAVAWAAQQQGLRWDQPDEIANLARRIRLEVDADRVTVDGRDVTAELRTSRVTAVTRYAADNPGVRAHLVALQRQLAQGKNVVTEGRDQGTVVFPHARCKFFLTASPEERARRRMQDLARRGETASFEEVLAQQIERDRGDSERAVGPLTPARDAIHVVTDGLTIEQVVDRLETFVRQRMD
jgi:cytidylate kinase/pantoate ligase/cytidylate kinase